MKKDNTYYLIRDILSCFPTTVSENLVNTLNTHLIAKERIFKIIKDESESKKPDYHVLSGALITLNAFLRQFPRTAFYEVIEVLLVAKNLYLKDKRKTIRGLSGEFILRLFLTLYHESCLIKKSEAVKYYQRFKKIIPKKEMNSIYDSKDLRTPIYYIFHEHGFELGMLDERIKMIKGIIGKFYK